MSQRSFASAEYAMKKKRTRRAMLLADMERVVPWARLKAVIAPSYPRSGRVGRPPIGVPKMLRMCCPQPWYGPADEALDTIVDATIIAAPSSTKNATGERDPDMHQTKKGNQWHFGVKAHIGVDAESGLTHPVIGTATNVDDVTQAGALRQGQQTSAFGDAGYRGVDKREEARGPTRFVAMQPGKRRALGLTGARLLEKAEPLKAACEPRSRSCRYRTIERVRPTSKAGVIPRHISWVDTSFRCSQRAPGGGEWHPDFVPHPEDVVVKEHWTASGFHNTDLDLQLKQRGISHVIVIGLLANTCIETTAKVAVELGYHVTLVKDATAAFSQEALKCAHEINGPTFAHAILSRRDLLAG